MGADGTNMKSTEGVVDLPCPPPPPGVGQQGEGAHAEKDQGGAFADLTTGLTSKDSFGHNWIVEKRVAWQISPHKTPSAGICGNLVQSKFDTKHENRTDNPGRHICFVSCTSQHPLA